MLEVCLKGYIMIPFIGHSRKGITIEMAKRSMVSRGLVDGERFEWVKNRGFFMMVKLFCIILSW